VVTTSPLPEGTITMLFSDIEGSTTLLQRLGPGYRDVLNQQRRIIRAAIEAYGGHEMGTEGDSFYVVFSSASAAVQAAVQAQRALVRVAAGGDYLRVRMGLHTGEPELHEEGYVGLDVHRAARVAAAANGGQIVLTSATWALAEGHVPGTVRDLGWHRLKDIQEPEHLLRLVIPDLVEEDRPVRTVGTPASLPRPGTSFVAREDLVQRVDSMLREHAVRLLTLVGPGGVGKSRLALEVAERCAEWVRDGVFFVRLADVRTTDDAWSAIGDAVGVPSTQREPHELLRWLRDRSLLLVLDNVEQLPDVHTVVGQLLDDTLDVELLITSRRPVRIMAEHRVQVPPLDEQDAVELFRQRLAAVRAGEPGDSSVLRELVRLVDGIPLAIELLAARGQLLGPSAMLQRFTDGLDLRSRATDVPERQRSLTAVLDWSYQLLPEAAASALRRLGAVAGPFGLAEARAAVDLPEEEVVDALLELTEASLVHAQEAPGGEPEFRMLRLVSSYASHLLAEDPAELAATRTRVSQQVRDWAVAVAEDLRTPRHLAARDAIERRQQLYRHVLEHALQPDSPDVVPGVEICAALSFYWYSGGYTAEGARWLSRAEAASAGLDDPVGTRALHGLGIMLMQQGKPGEAETPLRRALEVWQRAGDPVRTAVELNSLALARRMQGDLTEAGELFREAIEIAQRAGSDQLQVNAKSNLALLELDRGAAEEALRLFREVLELDTRLGDPWGIYADHVNIATSLVVAGDPDQAGQVLQEHGAGALALGDTDLSLEVVESLALVCVAAGLDDVAGRLLGAARTSRASAGLPKLGPELERFETLVAPLRERLGDRWEETLAEGDPLTLDAAFALGVRALGQLQ
jgi:predicted ATPase/class 3 adenylate cyclase